MAIFADHKALGIAILVLSVGRLLWRWTHPVPPLPSDLAGWEKALARTVHVIFYVLLIGLPLGLPANFAVTAWVQRLIDEAEGRG